MSISFARASRLASSSPKDFDFQFFIYQEEAKYPFWWSGKRFIHWFKSLPDNTFWNCVVCIMALVGVLLKAIDADNAYENIFDITYNLVYTIHVLGLFYDYLQLESVERTWGKKLGFWIDIVTYLHYPAYLLPGVAKWGARLFCYYLRLHRPFKYLWSLNDYNLKGSVVGTALKYCYIFMVVRVTCALIWLEVDEMEMSYEPPKLTKRDIYNNRHKTDDEKSWAHLFFNALYITNTMFYPIGPVIIPKNDYERILCLLVMITGCLVVAGAAVASLSLVIGIYMRPEEAFRARFKLIMKEMEDTRVLPELRAKVETFYKMYWHKQRAVSVTQLLPIFPPTLPAAIYTDIYFEAQQRSRILCDMSYQFLWELSKVMTTKNYIPGDAIIRRSTQKSSIIYITYGDVEMLTAEDDMTPILRMTRGSILSGCGGCASVACATAHVEIRAATFCTAHELNAKDLWRVALKYGKGNGQNFILLSSFDEHLEKVKRHYKTKLPENAKYKSSILHFKRSLMALKEAKDADGNLLLARTDVFLEVAGSYIMRNRADSSLIDEADAICLRPTFPCILQPTSSLQVIWQTCVACLIFTVCINETDIIIACTVKSTSSLTLAIDFNAYGTRTKTHPYVLMYQKNVPLEFRFYDYVVTVIFVLDLIVHLSTGANVEEGVPITFAQTSSQQMKSHWFVLDVLGTVPMFEFIWDGHFAGLNKLLRLPKVFRVLKSMEDVCVYYSNVLRFLSYSLLTFIACYLIAALQQGYMCYNFGCCLVRNFTKPPFWTKEPLDEETVEDRLMFGLYWATSLITFTSHKNAGITNWDNMVYTMILLEICSILYIFIEAVYSATIMVTTGLREDYDSCIEIVKHFLIKNNVDPLLRYRFITYLQLCWYTDKAYSMTHRKSSIFYDLPPHVYQDLVSRQRIKYLLGIPFMKYILKEDLKNIASHARLFYTSPNEILLNTGDISNEMYIIKQGICEILSPDTKGVVSSITAKDHFGVLECLLRLPAFYTVQAVTHVQVITISRKHLLKAIDLPKLKDAINFAKKQREYSFLLLRRESFLLYEPPPASPNREWFKLPRKHEPDTEFLQPFTKLGFLAVLRYIFPRYTIRPDSSYLTQYEWFRAVCALSSAMVFPSYTYLVLQWPGLYFLALLLDMTAYFDVLQRMLIGYFNEIGILVYHPSSTAAHYIKGAFITDLFGCLPLEHLESVRKESLQGRYQIPPTIQYLMLNRLLQLYRLPSAMNVINQTIERRDIILVIKAIPLFMALINVLTCVMVYCSVDIFALAGGKWQIVPHNDTDGSWIIQFGDAFRFNMTETPWNLHLATYFWVVYETTTTGYNIFNPSNLQLTWVLFSGMMIGAMMTTYFSVRIISIRANVNKAVASFQQHMKDIATYMRKEKLNKELQREVLAHYEYSWDKMGGTDYRSVLKLCDQINLRTDAILHIYGQTFAKCPILYHCDLSLLRIVGRAVRSNYFLIHTKIIDTDNVIDNMYFVDYGTVEVMTINERVTTIVKLQRGSVFGNLVSTSPTVRCPTTIVATSNVHLLQLNTQTFYKIIMDFPTVKVLMKKYRPHNENYIVGSFGDSTDLSKNWKERTRSSSAFIVAGRRGLAKHLYIHNKFSLIYLILISMLCMYGDVYNAGFQDNRIGLILALYILDMGFYLKILMNYMLPLIVEEPEIRDTLMAARFTYFRSEFKYDIMSCLPIELFGLIRREDRWWYFSMLRLNRMFRMVTVYSCIKRHHEKLSINLVLSTVFSVFIWFTLFMHILSCMWYYLGVTEDLIEPNSSWIHNKNGPACDNHYVCSMYFILTTFTHNGVGDILPKKQSEVIFVVILQIMSTMVYMVYVGEFSNIIQYQSFRSFSYYCKYLELQEFLKNNRVARNLVTIVNKYSLHLWRESRGVQAPHFLVTAPQCLKLKVMSAAYLHHFTKHPVFKDCELAFLRELVCCSFLFHYNKDMYVVKECEITDAMYIIHKGKVQELDEDMERTVGIYKEGECFGMEQGLVRNSAYPYSYRTMTKAQVLTLRLDDWEYLLKHFPASNEVISKSGYQRPPENNRKKSSVIEKLQEGEKKHVHIQSKDLTAIATEERIFNWGDSLRLHPPTPPDEKMKRASEKQEAIDVKEATETNKQTELKGRDSVKGFTKEKFKFKPPPGPSNKDIGPPIVVEPDLWPMDSRRRSTKENVDKQAVAKELDELKSTLDLAHLDELPKKAEETKLGRTLSITSVKSDDEDNEPIPTDMRRRSTVHNIDRQAVTEELEKLKSPLDLTHLDELPKKAEETKLGRTVTRISVKSEDDEDNEPIPANMRRRSTVHNIDREAVVEELDKLKSSLDLTHLDELPKKTEERKKEHELSVTSIESDEPAPKDRRRRSTIHNIDRELVSKELEALKSSTDLTQLGLERISSESFQSTKTNVNEASLATSSKRRELTSDPDNTLKKGSKFIRHMSQAAIDLIRKRSSTASVDRDLVRLEQDDFMLREEDEQVTKELIKKYEEEEERRSIQSMQGIVSNEKFDEWYRSIKKKKQSDDNDSKTSILTLNESLLSLDVRTADSSGSVEGYLLEKLGKEKEKEKDAQKDDANEATSIRHSGASLLSGRAKRSVRVRYQDQQYAAAGSSQSIAARQLPPMQARLSDSKPVGELTAEERLRGMMDSDVEHARPDNSNPQQSTADTDSTVTLTPNSPSKTPKKNN